MQRLTELVVLVSCLVSAAALAETSEWYGPETSDCRDQSTLGLVNCTQALTRRWDGRLNRAYKALMAEQSAGQRQALRAA